MPYLIVFHKDGQVFGTVQWDADLESAKTNAIDYFSIYRAQSVVVMDDNDEIVFSYPGDTDTKRP